MNYKKTNKFSFRSIFNRNQQGFTLLEVLISMVVLAIGLFGLAGLQVMSVRSNTSAYYRSVASMMAYDIMDSIRANPVGLAAGDYDLTDATSASPPGNADTPHSECNVTSPPYTNICTKSELAENDLYVWLTADYKLGQLPIASASISKTPIIDKSDGTTTIAYNVKVDIKWKDFSNKKEGADVVRFGDSDDEVFTYSTIVRVGS